MAPAGGASAPASLESPITSVQGRRGAAAAEEPRQTAGTSDADARARDARTQHFRSLTESSSGGAFKSRELCGRGPAPPPLVESSLAAGAGAGAIVRLRLSARFRESTSRGIGLPGSAPYKLLVFVGKQFMALGLSASWLLPRCSLPGRRNAVVGATSGSPLPSSDVPALLCPHPSVAQAGETCPGGGQARLKHAGTGCAAPA